MKRRRHQQNEHEIEDNKDMLSNLPDCILLHVLSFLKVRTCLLSRRWKHIWRHLPTLTLSYRRFRNTKCYTEFVTRFLSLRDASTALTALDFEPFYSRKFCLLEIVTSYAASHNVNRLRLFGVIRRFPPSLFSCRSLTSLDIEFTVLSSVSFPNSLNMPALTYLKLHYFSFCSGNDGRVEPFSNFNMLNTLILYRCKVWDAQQTLCISNTTLLNLSIHSGYYYYHYYLGEDYSKIELSAPNLCTFDFSGKSSLKFCWSSLSSIKQLSIGISDHEFSGEISSWLFNWLIEVTDIKSLTVTPTPSTLKALSLVPNILKLKLPSLCNLRSLKLNLIPSSYGLSEMCWRDIKLELASGKSWKENAKLRKTIKRGLKPCSFIPDEMIDFLLQNSPSAKLDICLATFNSVIC